jgi:energy-coupling factor transporter ATP-binding protein EcfA2
MILLELALLGVRNFQQITRLEFSPGLNFIQGGNGSGKTTLRDTILLSLFGQLPEQFQTLIHGSSRSTCQAAITFKTKNGDLCRLAKDFVKDIAILSKHDPSIQKFLPIEKRRENVLRWFQQQCGGLQEHRISYYFSLSLSRLPSYRLGPDMLQPVESSSLSAGPPAASLSSQTAMEFAKPGDLIAKQKRLQELKAIADKAEELFQLEEQISDAQSRVGILKRKLADLQRVDQEIEQINEKAKTFTGLSEGLAGPARARGVGASEDVLEGHRTGPHIEGWTAEQLQELVEEFESKLTERNREYQTLEEDRSLLEHQLGIIPIDPIYKNKLFIAGAVATALSFGIGLFVTLPGFYQHFYLLGLSVGLGLMATSVVVDMRWHSRKKLLEDKLQGKLKNIELLEARFRRENIKFFDLLKKTNTDSVETFKEKLKAYEFLSGSRQRLFEERERLLEGQDIQSLQTEYDEKLGLIQEVNQKMKRYQGIPVDLPSLRDEIRILEKEVAAASGGKQHARSQAGFMRHTPPSQQSKDSPNLNNGHQNSIHELLKDPLVTQNQLFNTAREIFKKVSFGTYLDLILDESSRISLIPNGSPTPVPLEALSHGTLDQVFLSLYLGLLLNLSPDYAFPVLLDDPLVTLDSKRQEVILEVLREISQQRQVILLSCTFYPGKEGEGQIRLP